MAERSVTVRRQFAAPAERVFDAWLEPQSLAAWMAHGSRAQARVDPRDGGTFEVMDDGRIVFAGIFHRIERPQRLVFSWLAPSTHAIQALVRVEFRARDHGTEVIVVTSSIRGQSPDYSPEAIATPTPDPAAGARSTEVAVTSTRLPGTRARAPRCRAASSEAMRS